MKRVIKGMATNVTNKLGFFWKVIEPTVDNATTLTLTEEQYAVHKAACVETREAALEVIKLADMHEANIEDRKLSGKELFSEFLQLEAVTDETEDIFKLEDEDDPPAT